MAVLLLLLLSGELGRSGWLSSDKLIVGLVTSMFKIVQRHLGTELRLGEIDVFVFGGAPLLSAHLIVKLIKGRSGLSEISNAEGN